MFRRFEFCAELEEIAEEYRGIRRAGVVAVVLDRLRELPNQ